MKTSTAEVHHETDAARTTAGGSSMTQQPMRQLLIFGVLLFLFGLLNGAVIPYFTNPRMGLSAHLAGVQNGMALLIFGLLWPYLTLSSSTLSATYWLSLYGMYAIWGGLLFAAVWGTSRATPIAGAGYSASSLYESIVQLLLSLGSVAIIIATVFVLLGLIRTK
jgi:(hydroxyamino)benzene mutase